MAVRWNKKSAEGMKLGLQGAQQAADHADSLYFGWQAKAFNLFCKFKAYSEPEFLCEDFTAFAEKRGLPKPPTRRAYAQVIQMAKKHKLIVSAGQGQSKVKSNHAGWRGKWKWAS